MTGLLTLPGHILCKREVLGKTFDCRIAGIEVQICFPQYPIVDTDNPIIGIMNPLLPPIVGTKWKRGKETLSWGEPLDYPEGNSCVHLLALSITCEKEQVSDYARRIYASIQKWVDAFINHLILDAKQGLERNENTSQYTSYLELLDDKYISDNKTINISLRIPDAESYASEMNIINAIAFANSGKELLLEYQMLLSAYEAIQLNQNRRAILDACSAMEITIVNQINQYCLSKGVPPEILINKYRFLGERIELLKKIGCCFPNEDYKALVVDPRNALMHNKDINPSDETTDKLFSCVETFINHFYSAYY